MLSHHGVCSFFIVGDAGSTLDSIYDVTLVLLFTLLQKFCLVFVSLLFLR